MAGFLPPERREPEAEAHGRPLDSDVGRPLAPEVASRMGATLGRDVSGAVVHTGPEGDALARRTEARAVTWGRHIAFADDSFRPGTVEGDAILAHELAHTAQQASVASASDRASPDALPVAHDAALETQADAAALSASTGSGRSPTTGLAQRAGGGLALARCSRPDPVEQALKGRRSWTTALAEQAVRRYEAASPADRQRLIDRYAATQFGAMLAALPAGSTSAGGAFEVPVRDMLQRIQRSAARSDAAAQGLATDAAMAQAQATEMTNRNQAAAAAALPVGAPPPTTAQVAAQQQGQVAATSIAPQTAVMTAAQEATINSTLNGTSIPAFVTWCTAHHPGLGITAAHLRADARAVFDRGISVLAFADMGATRAVVGESFAQAVALNPAYALPTVVHELWGHRTYGEYGSAGSEYGLELYDRAAALMPGYTAPAAGSAARTSELDAYAYQETEMYSLMREVPYFTPNAPAHAAAMASINFDPAPEIQTRIQTIHDQWEPRLARALLHGLYRRFLVDPTVSAPALTAFRNGVRAVFSASDAGVILS